MRIKVSNGERKYLELPMTDSELNYQMRRLGIISKVPVGRLVEVLDKEDPLCQFEGNQVNMDEINYYAKRRESLSAYEQKLMAAYVHEYGVDSLQGLINLTFSLQGLSLITDFSDAEQVGKRLYLDEHLAVTEKETEQVDFIGFANEILRKNQIVIQPQGVFVVHGFAMQEIYNGNTFPLYYYGNDIVAAVELQNHSGEKEYLYLPTDICSMDKVKNRLQVSCFMECEVTDVQNILLPEELIPSLAELKQIEILTFFNELCQTIQGFSQEKMQQLLMAVSLIETKAVTDITYIAKNLSEFEIYPEIYNDEAYGKYLIAESGMFAVEDVILPHINYVSFANSAKDVNHVFSGYVKDGFVGTTRERSEYLKYHGEFADPLEMDEGIYEMFCLYSPLAADILIEDEYVARLNQRELLSCTEEIIEAIKREDMVGVEVRGLMHYFDRNQEVAAKVISAFPGVKVIDDQLYGVLQCRICAPLNEQEIEILKEFWTGQMSDGWGEGFEQHAIEIEDGELSVHFWDEDEDWQVMTQKELDERKQTLCQVMV